MSLVRYTVHKQNDNTYAIEEKTPISQGLCYLLCGEERALLIDTCFGFKGLKPVVDRLTRLPVIVANTHAHVDHIGGNRFFEEVWFHEADEKIFAMHTDPDYVSRLEGEKIPLPVRAFIKRLVRRASTPEMVANYKLFKDGHIFNLGGREVEVVHTPGHTPGSVCFLDRASRMLFTGDTICEWGILLHFTKESCPPSVFGKSMERAASLEDEFEVMWPGHHGFPVDKGYIEEYLTCANQIVAGTAAMGTESGRSCARYGRILITVPQEAQVNG